jgi:hypothetical protein
MKPSIKFGGFTLGIHLDRATCAMEIPEGIRQHSWSLAATKKKRHYGVAERGQANPYPT